MKAKQIMGIVMLTAVIILFSYKLITGIPFLANNIGGVLIIILLVLILLLIINRILRY